MHASLLQIDIIRWGPLRSTWCMMFEHMNQVVKFSSLRNNFLNTLHTTASKLAEALAFDLFTKRHAHFQKPLSPQHLNSDPQLLSSVAHCVIVCPANRSPMFSSRRCAASGRHPSSTCSFAHAMCNWTCSPKQLRSSGSGKSKSATMRSRQVILCCARLVRAGILL